MEAPLTCPVHRQTRNDEPMQTATATFSTPRCPRGTPDAVRIGRAAPDLNSTGVFITTMNYSRSSMKAKDKLPSLPCHYSNQPSELRRGLYAFLPVDRKHQEEIPTFGAEQPIPAANHRPGGRRTEPQKYN